MKETKACKVKIEIYQNQNHQNWNQKKIQKLYVEGQKKKKEFFFQSLRNVGDFALFDPWIEFFLTCGFR